MNNGYYIKTKLWGKTRYWDAHYGLHAGTGKTNGFSKYETEKKALQVIEHLKKVFSGDMEFFVIRDEDLPFIKKQINKQKKKWKN